MQDIFSSDSDEFEHISERMNKLKTLIKPDNFFIVKDEALLIEKFNYEKILLHVYLERFERCKELDFNLRKISKDFPSIKFYRISGDDCRLITEKFDVTVLPFLGFIRDGRFVQENLGFENIGENYCDPELLKELIKKHLC